MKLRTEDGYPAVEPILSCCKVLDANWDEYKAAFPSDTIDSPADYVARINWLEERGVPRGFWLETGRWPI